jgi:predicted aspartyl protease
MRIKAKTLPRNYRASIAAGFCLAGIAVDTAWAADTPDCNLTVLAGLDMRTLADGRISIPVKANGQDLFLMVDTGGSQSTISPPIAAKMQLPLRVSSIKLATIGDMAGHLATFKDFSLASLSTHNISFFVQPPGWSGVGSIASDLLRGYDVDFDFAGSKFNLISPRHCPGKVVYWTKDSAVAIVPLMVDGNSGHIRIPVTLDGKKMEATIDTGADNSVMSAAAASSYLNLDEQSPGMKAENAIINGVAMKQYRYAFKSLGFEGIAVSNPDVVILPNQDMRYLGSDIILGVDILRQLHMYIAYKEGKLYLSSATAH